jgi:hypothetical protein
MGFMVKETKEEDGMGEWGIGSTAGDTMLDIEDNEINSQDVRFNGDYTSKMFIFISMLLILPWWILDVLPCPYCSLCPLAFWHNPCMRHKFKPKTKQK